ncbi:histone-lysine N-methyltransferase SETD7-like [Tigriopus californicus]|uniref:histone-lysine N-methyltransferase SETD7-like n=1 Tax=Tigriopus californicus TaxID=6832 RepID=UPI0027DA89EE|nr:histone-lysine N-methyltransferase SETD7-like [Tigriopus californicus]
MSRYRGYQSTTLGYSSRRYNFSSHSEPPPVSRAYTPRPAFDSNEWRIQQSQRRLANLNMNSAFDKAQNRFSTKYSSSSERFQRDDLVEKVSWRDIFNKKMEQEVKPVQDNNQRPLINTKVEPPAPQLVTPLAKINGIKSVESEPRLKAQGSTESLNESDEWSWEEYSESESDQEEVHKQSPKGPLPSPVKKVLPQPASTTLPGLKFTPAKPHKEDLSWVNQRQDKIIVDSMHATLDKWLKAVSTWANDPWTAKGQYPDGSVRAGTKSTDPYSRLQDEIYDYVGERNFFGKPHGKGVVTFANGDKLTGSFRDGKREGKCSLQMRSNDIVYLDANYTNDKLNGKGKIEYKNGDLLYGWFVFGTLHGLGKTFNKEKQLIQVCWYSNGVPVGTVWKFLQGGGILVGEADITGNLIGDDIAFLYPDHQTALLGTFVREKMCMAQIAFIQMVTVRHEMCQLKFTKPRGPLYIYDPGTLTRISTEPLLPDPYETQHVYVRASKLRGAQEGLFANKDLPTDRIVAFYNGIHLRENELVDDKSDHDANAYKILDLQGPDSDGFQGILDIPPEYVNIKRFGKIPAIQTVMEITKDTEIFVSYDYDLEEAPPWYQDLFSKRVILQYQQSKQMWNL